MQIIEGIHFYRERPCLKCKSHIFYIKNERCAACNMVNQKRIREQIQDSTAPISHALLLYIIEHPWTRDYAKIARIMGCSMASVRRAFNFLNIPQHASMANAFGYRG